MGRVLRLFVAAYPPRSVVEGWLCAARAALPPDVRFTAPEPVHLTLVFLGEHDERELPDIRESIGRSVAGFQPIALKACELVMLPERGMPRLLAAISDLPRFLAEIQRRLAQRLALNRARRSEFMPHFTLARFPGKAVERFSTPLPGEEFVLGELRLMRSRICADGAVHEVDKVFALQPA